MPFNWTPQRLQRLRSAVRSFNAAITRRERELGEGNPLASALPERVTVQGTRDRIHDVNDFRRIVGYKGDAARGRTSELTRILKSVRPDALEFTETNGYVETNYSRREYANARSRVDRIARRQRELRQTELFEGDSVDDFSDMTPQEAMTAADRTEIPVGEGEEDGSVVDVDAATIERWNREDARKKSDSLSRGARADAYISTWMDPLNMHEMMPGYQQLIDDFRWIEKNRPDALDKIFARGYDELTIPWIIPSDLTNPYTNIPFTVRHGRAVAKFAEIRGGLEASGGR